MKKSMFFLFCLATGATLLLRPVVGFSQEFSVTSVMYSMQDSDVVVRYDLNGPTDKQYKVQLVLRRQGQPSFKFTPMDVTGNVGSKVAPGPDKEIVWHLYKEVPYGLDGDDYYFEVSVTRMGVKSGGVSWLYYVGGALLGGAAAVYFGTNLFNKPWTSSIPAPPLRPQ